MTRVAILLSFTLACVAACTSPPPARPNPISAMKKVDTSKLIGLAKALEIAKAKVPSGVPISAELEIEDEDEKEPPAYEVKFYVSGSDKITEVEVHAMTGKVLEVEQEGAVDDEDDGDDGDDD